ncbi:MAG: hypothetical protein HGN29_05355 [Asgard group archaeon]|nr:hypothetical protein [Asgard group archaeon]
MKSGVNWLHQRFVSSIVESCTKDQSYVIMLKWDAINEVHTKLKQKCELVQQIGGIIEKYQYKDLKISFYKTGKLLLTNVNHIDVLLKELFK